MSVNPNNNPGVPPPNPPLDDDPIREHTFDGIQEYDKRMPNWWLWTLFGAIAFSVGYWMYLEYPKTLLPDGPRVEAEMNRIALAAQNSGVELTDEQLWAMSKDPKIASAGQTTFQTTCASCHLEDLSGKIGPNLKDTTWINGGLPRQVVQTIINGVPAKGMPTWGPVLGRAKIAEVAAYIMSYHAPGDPIIEAGQGAGAEPPAAAAVVPAASTSVAP